MLTQNDTVAELEIKSYVLSICKLVQLDKYLKAGPHLRRKHKHKHKHKKLTMC